MKFLVTKKSIPMLPQFGSVSIGGYAHTDGLMHRFPWMLAKEVLFPTHDE